VSSIAAFAWTCFVIELTPGPNMTYLAVLTLSQGRKAGLAAVAGVGLGLAIVGLLAALGVGTLIASSPVLYQALRFGGVAYLLWLAWETWTAETDLVETDADIPLSADRVIYTSFRNGLVTNLLNPKAALFYIAILPVFMDSSRPAVEQGILLAVIYVLIATAIHAAIVLMAAKARPLIAASGRMEHVRRILALMLLAIAIWMLWATRR